MSIHTYLSHCAEVERKTLSRKIGEILEAAVIDEVSSVEGVPRDDVRRTLFWRAVERDS